MRARPPCSVGAMAPRAAVLVLLTCAACGGHAAAAPSSDLPVHHSLAVVPLPALPSRGLAISHRHGIVLADDRGRPIVRLRGWELGGATMTSPFVLTVYRHHRAYRLDVAGHRLVPLPGDWSNRLAGGYRFARTGPGTWAVYDNHGARVLQAHGDLTISADRRLIGVGRTGLDVTDMSRTTMPRRCGVGARDGASWYLLCGNANGPWVDVITGGLARVLAPRLGHGFRDGWDGLYESVTPSPDGRSLLLQYSGECETPIAFEVGAAGGRPRPVVGGAWQHAPESVGVGWTHAGAALVQLLPPACGASRRPGLWAFHGGAAHRIAGVGTTVWGAW